MGKVVHFEIQASDIEKIAKFYSDVLGWEINEWVIPGVDLADEDRYWLISAGEEEQEGVNGGMLIRRGDTPSDGQPVNAFVCVIDVVSLDETLQRVEKAGGQITVSTMAVPGVGWSAYCKDPDGNIFGLLQADPNAS